VDRAIEFLSHHWLEATVGGVLFAIVLAVLWFWLQRPTKEEMEHERRFQELKEKSKDTYRRLRPLK
jgi:cbb3-type cytochrome oxidase subunit 3